MMVRFLNSTVESILHQQVELIGPEAISLHSLWRAAGCPEGRHPRDWVDLAAPILSGFERYQRVIDAAEALHPGPRGLVWVWDGDDGEPWRQGDLMTHELLARIYVAYLERSA